MGQYDKLDLAIIERIKKFGEAKLFRLSGGDVATEAISMTSMTGREEYRIIDGRLQSLRKRGVLQHDTKRGWSIANKT